jgi:hypothetical protein
VKVLVLKAKVRLEIDRGPINAETLARRGDRGGRNQAGGASMGIARPSAARWRTSAGIEPGRRGGENQRQRYRADSAYRD